VRKPDGGATGAEEVYIEAELQKKIMSHALHFHPLSLSTSYDLRDSVRLVSARYELYKMILQASRFA